MGENDWIPTIEVESANGTREVSLYTSHLMDRIIFLNGEIKSEKANLFLSQLLYLEKEADKPITIYINSIGGEVNAGLMIYDAIQGCKAEINMICTGMAASMAAVILAGGRKGHRYILKHSEIMIHEPLIPGGVGGSATSIRNISESIMETRRTVNRLLASHTGKTLKEIDSATAFDNYMNAKEAIEFGICDSITDSLKIDNGEH